MFENEDIVELISLFNKHKVKFMLVGGYAVIHYTEPRYTKDVDFYVLASQENAKKICAALEEFGLSLEVLPDGFFASEENYYKLGAPPWRVDIITSLKGISYEEIMERCEVIQIREHILPIISKEDLIKVKKIAGRPHDLVDVEKLERI